MLLLDGKTFAEDQGVIALGVTPTGEKRVLGVVQTATENKRACAAFLRELIERGLAAPVHVGVRFFGGVIPATLRACRNHRERVSCDTPTVAAN